MAIKTLAQLRIDAQVIKNEVTTGANTALRVGTLQDETLESLDSIQGHLWEFVLDSLYTTGNTLDIAGGDINRTKVTINGGLGHDHSPNFTGDLWNSGTNKFEPLALHDFYMMRFAISGWSNSPDNRFDVEFDVNGASGVIARETAVFAKGTGIDNRQSFNFSSGFFAGPDFFTNGGEIYIITKASASFYELAVTISRTYTPEV